MRVGFDAKRITHNSTGLGNYSRYIVNNLAKYYPADIFELYTPGKGKEILRNRIENYPNLCFKYPERFYHKWFPSLWRSSGIVSDLKKNKVELFHGLSGELPKGLKKNEIRSVVTIHDLIFLRYPQYYKSLDRKIYQYKFKTACIEADKIIAISNQTKEDIIDFFHINEDKIEVIYQGCDPSFEKKVSVEKQKQIKKKYNITNPFILYVGSIEERKNLLLLLEALKYVQEDISVIAIGRSTEYTQSVEKYISENSLTRRIQILNNIPFNELPAFYQMARLFVYPSRFEGFGIPLIEALHSEIPVIGATGSCLEEAGGPESLYTDPDNPKELAELINEVLTKPDLREKMIKSGKEFVRRFDAKISSGQIMNIYKSLL